MTSKKTATIDLAIAIINDYRVNKKRTQQLLAKLRRLAKNPADRATRTRAEQLAGRLNHAGNVVKPELTLPTATDDLRLLIGVLELTQEPFVGSPVGLLQSMKRFY